MGRPREFDIQVALRAALEVFWRKGYAATSLDDLTAAMALSRSSFYGAFGSKHDVLIAAVRHYVDDIFADLHVIANSNRDPNASIRAIIEAMARPRGDDKGCLLVNSIAELAPEDLEVCEIARMQIGRIMSILKGLLIKSGHSSKTAEHLAGALISCAFGATTLRKAGLPAIALVGLLKQIERLLTPPE